MRRHNTHFLAFIIIAFSVVWVCGVLIGYSFGVQDASVAAGAMFKGLSCSDTQKAVTGQGNGK